MDSVLNFLADYYFIFLGVSVVLLIALIGFIAGSRKKAPEVQTASDTAQPDLNQSEPMGVSIDEVAPQTPEVTVSVQPMDSEVTPVVEPTPSVNNINADIPLPPEEVKSEAPTLIIEDPSAPTSAPAPEVAPTPVVSEVVAPTPVASEPVTPAAPVTPAPGQSLFEVSTPQTQQSLFEVPNNNNQNM